MIGNTPGKTLPMFFVFDFTGKETPWQRYWDCPPSTLHHADRHWLSSDGGGPQGIRSYADLTGMINW